MANNIDTSPKANKLNEDDSSFMNRAFIEQHLGKILMTVILLLTYIQLRYEYEDRILSIANLKTELNDVRYTSVEKWGRLTQKASPEVIRAKVAESTVNLIESDEPPVRIK